MLLTNIFMKYRSLYLLSLLFLIIGSQGFSQKVKIWQQDLTTESRETNFRTDDIFNGLTLIFKDAFPVGLYFISADGKKIEVTQDEHMEDRIQSNLIYLNKAVNEYTLIFPTSVSAITAVYQYVPPISLNNSQREGDLNCEEPPFVPQSVWRKGLEPPVPGRTSTPTRHCIVHHSASNNGDTNSVNLVRAFYIQHKEVNGWDDIGYNFLIGHDGTVFAGRDPEKPGIEQDNVFGAHFCGKNSYTMGICVIGSFEEEAPDARAVNALERLLTWKMFKDEMNPLDSLHHPDTINSDLLPVLAGHRNGCATECPGQLLFDQLPILRLKIADNLTQCAPLSTKDLSENNVIQILPNPSTGQFQIRMDDNITYNYQLINSTGQLIKSGQIGNMQMINIDAQRSGIYFLKLYDKKFQKVVKLIVSY
jgi:hypothetical protein